MVKLAEVDTQTAWQAGECNEWNRDNATHDKRRVSASRMIVTFKNADFAEGAENTEQHRTPQ